MAESEGPSARAAPPRPTLALPPRENLFLRGANASPGPMTLVSSFFSESEPESDCHSFSQLLAGAMTSPGATRWPKGLPGHSPADGPKEENVRFKQSYPMSFMMAQSPGPFMIPPGLSLASLLDSPVSFAPSQGHFEISHQEALAQVTAQAAQSHSQMHNQAECPLSLMAPSISSSQPTHPANTTVPHQKTPSLISDVKTITVEMPEASDTDQRSQPPVLTIDKPADDGYNWRKYGQKQVKCSEYPRSYYKCSHPNCPVRKKVERSFNGQITEIIYKGQHNHQKPQPNKCAKEGVSLPSGPAEPNGRIGSPKNSELGPRGQTGSFGQLDEIVGVFSASKWDLESVQVTTPDQLSGSSIGEEVGNTEMRNDAGDDNEPDPKRRHIDVRATESASSHRTVTEPRIIVQTTSEVDLLDDGYRWRKYGQKVVKRNPHPRSYYKCTNVGCNVRKHVERASSDPKAVITTYEGKHNHDLPAAKNSSHNPASNTAAINGVLLKMHDTISEKHASLKAMDFRNNNAQLPTSLLQLKEEL